ncbi:Rieske 2Fe-2S domain-containing protein [Novosphingobium sp. FSY-8]|uniref:Rieske 2Fe-2S domain-containing protein n=2 Tax=Novosphingobium ovatum TaxID=1908523 RepID=A0ABW9XDV2_9SPHN|nr:Rieske 2Fe-2S domain-containing protein [Novosphingobium ovatum]
MFPQFAALWTPVALATEVVAGRPYALVIADTRVVLFRDAAGDVAALIDRCPHRGVALSLGRVEGGQIACPFHGWRFDGAGACTHVPWNPDAKRGALSATALPVRVAGGLVWVHTAPGAPDGEPFVPPVLLRDDVRVMAQHMVWDVHWTRVMENMLDTPHLPFVHAGTIGKGLRGRTDAAMTMAWNETPSGAQITATRAGEAPKTTLAYHFPNVMELSIDPGGRVLRMLAVCLPQADGRTRLSIYSIRNFAKWAPLDRLFARMNARIAAEDKAIIESSQPATVPPAGEERSVPTDIPTLAFRKIWFTRIQPQRIAP